MPDETTGTNIWIILVEGRSVMGLNILNGKSNLQQYVTCEDRVFKG